MSIKKMAVLVFCFATVLLTACNPANENEGDVSETVTTTVSDTSAIVTELTNITDTSEVTTTTEITESQIHAEEAFSSRYGYYQLSEDEKKVYNQIKSAAKRFQTTVDLDIRLPRASIKRICEILVLEDNDLYYLTTSYSWTYNKVTDLVSQVTLSYQYNSMTVELINQKVEEKADEIFENITDDMTDYDKVKYFHDVIVTSCITSEDGDYVATPYGALVDGKALCEGYSRAFAYLCNRAEIENIFATGVTVTGINHMWNMVKIDNKWYNIDLTWDDQNDTNGEFGFLNGNYVAYDYFLFKTSMYGDNMKISDLYTLPQTVSDEHNYFVKNDLVAKSYDEAVKLMERELKAKFKAKESIVNIQIENDEDFRKASEVFSTVKIYKYVPDAYGYRSLFFLNNEDANTIQIIYKFDK